MLGIGSISGYLAGARRVKSKRRKKERKEGNEIVPILVYTLRNDLI
jgi:hypothetical protein